MSALLGRRIFLIYSIITFINGLLAQTSDSKASPSPNHKKEDEFCKSPECINMNENLKNKIDLSYDPCTQFYQYACNHYTDIINEVDKSEKKVFQQLLSILKEPIGEDDIELTKMTKKMYQSCLNHGSNVEGLKTLIDQIGGWWLLDQIWDDSKFSLENIYTNSFKNNYYPKSLFTVDVTTDETDVSRNIFIVGGIFIKEADLEIGFDSIRGIKESSPEKDDLYIKNFVNKIGPKLSNKQETVTWESEAYKRIRKSLLRIYRVERYQEPVEKSQRMTLDSLIATYSNIPFLSTFNSILKPKAANMKEPIIVECPKCLKAVDNLIKNELTKSLNNYLMWSLVIKFGHEADGEVLQHLLDTTTNGMSKEEYCANVTIEQFRRVMDYEFVNKDSEYVKQEPFNKCLQCSVSDYIKSLKDSMFHVMRIFTIDSDKNFFLNNANSKIAHTQFKIGYDEQISSEEELKKYFNDPELVIHPDSYVFAVLNITYFKLRKTIENYPNSSEVKYLTTTRTASAYIPHGNIIQAGARIFTSPFYSTNRPEYLNYAGLAFIIAREMNHAFDNLNYKFDAYGKPINFSLSNINVERLIDKYECLENQYSKLGKEQNKLQNNKTTPLSSIFADNGGALVAYRAYEKWLKNNKEKSLQHFKSFTPNQMFWISLAGILCANSTKNNNTNNTYFDSFNRVTGIAINSEYFARDFKCEAGKPMNPSKKCEIWK